MKTLRGDILFSLGLFFIWFILAQVPTCVRSGQIFSGIRDRRRPPQVTAGIAGGILRRPGDRRAGPTKRVHFPDDLPTLRFGVPEREQHAGPGRRRPARRRRLHGVSQPLPGQMPAPSQAKFPAGATPPPPAAVPQRPGQETPAVQRKFPHGPSAGFGTNYPTGKTHRLPGQGWEVTKF
uniref:Uncharacterized protein n=1 Tax=Rhipicephalus appendiculatus TaxID=34631 RepID=A0A131YFG4_RHIAP